MVESGLLTYENDNDIDFCFTEHNQFWCNFIKLCLYHETDNFEIILSLFSFL